MKTNENHKHIRVKGKYYSVNWNSQRQQWQCGQAYSVKGGSEDMAAILTACEAHQYNCGGIADGQTSIKKMHEMEKDYSLTC